MESDRRDDTVVRRLLEAFWDQLGPGDGAVVARAPGRVNLIGDHTDYNEGYVLPITIDRAVYVVARARSDDRVQVFSSQFQEEITYRLEAPPKPRAGRWASYVIGTVEELRRGGHFERGFELLISGDVPLGAGLSSSAALETAIVVVLSSLFGFTIDPLEAVRLTQQVEHRYAGVQCGIMDQFVSRFGRSGRALFLDCRTLEYEHVPLPLDELGLEIVVADSQMQRELAASKYGERRAECERIVAAVQRDSRRVTAIRDLKLEDIDEELLGEVLYRRARHVIEENCRVLDARDALVSRDYVACGRLMNESHESLRDLYAVSIPELDMLVEASQVVDGVLGARMTGGGFGGCTVQLVRREAVPQLCESLREAYGSAFGREPKIYRVDRNFEAAVLSGGR